MKRFTSIIKLGIASLLAVAVAFAADARTAPAEIDIHKQSNLRKTERFTRANRAAHIADVKAKMERNDRRMAAAAEEEIFEPAITFGPVQSFGDIDGPNGETWFYTLSHDNKAIEHEAYTEFVLQAFHLYIYNETGELVGEIHDKMRYLDNEIRTVLVDLLPVITSKYFNSTPDYEVCFGFAVNTTTEGRNHYRSVAYSIGGQKDADGWDLPIAELPELIVDVLDASTDTEEKFYFTLAQEGGGGSGGSSTWETEAYWESFKRARVRMDTYGPFNAEGQANIIFTKDIPLCQLPGDQESGGYMLSFMHGNQPKVAYSYYKEPLTEPYYYPWADLVQRENNTFVVEIYDIDANGQFTLVQTTEIPMTIDNDNGADTDVWGTYYGIGFMRYQRDIDYDNFNTGDKAALFVTTQNYRISADGIAEASFYLYNPDGTLRNVVFEDAENMLAMANVPGHESQIMFVTDEGGYTFNFMDMETFTLRSKVNYYLPVPGSDDEQLTFNIDRVAYGDTYLYADELRWPVEDEDNVYMRIAWIDKDGKWVRTDEVNMGKDINYAMSYIDGAVLDPHMYYNDDEHEYMMLMKHATGELSTQEELLIAQPRSEAHPEGRELLRITPDSKKGVLSGISPFTHIAKPKLCVVFAKTDYESYYSSMESYSVDFYDLPLNGEADQVGVGSIAAAGAQGNISFDGSTLSAAGTIELFNLQGVRVAVAQGSLSTEGLAAGMYIARAAGSTAKISIR